ncbi:MAG TPA: copper resistance protein CopC [Thermoleophilaceae bacterium]
MRRLLGLVVAAALISPSSAAAHAALTGSDPAAGARLGATPSVVRLSFTERPDPSLSRIDVVDTAGQVRQRGRAAAVAGDPRTLAVPVTRLPRGSYTVRYRVIAGDGHPTAGQLTFGVQAAAGAATAAPARSLSPLEAGARTAFIVGLVLVLGAAAAALGGFGGMRDLRLAAGGWLLATAALVLLAETQRRSAHVGFGTLLDSSAGDGLLKRGAALIGCGTALEFARSPRRRRLGLGLAGLLALLAIEAHVATGHASVSPARVIFQFAHFGAAGVWIGGLVALLLGRRRSIDVRRFSRIAGAAFGVVVVTGALRAVEQVPSPAQLVTSAYGRMILVKVALVVPIALFAWRNRRAVVSGRLGNLVRTSRAELGLAGGALLAAAVLGALAPPVVTRAAGPRGLLATGQAGATAIRLTTTSTEPGPNRFVLRVERGRSPAHARLRFTPLDDPGVRPTTLDLRRESDATYAATGSGLAFDGRWRVDAQLDRTTIPLELDPEGPEQFLSVLRPPGKPAQYTHFIPRLGYVRVIPNRVTDRVQIRLFDVFASSPAVRTLVFTHTRHRKSRTVEVKRIGPARYAGALTVDKGDALAVTARLRNGKRMRSVFEIES